ncbi:unnamed protein product [Paramecium pentaurelia]|uniref:Uncharacterized protein n=1 Tax=Paramecium pentaurelia TaxID=43138 RepID=A0A8S1U0W2_9CILI|nr:unnamed protein product [Paramecium pentaurelia]
MFLNFYNQQLIFKEIFVLKNKIQNFLIQLIYKPKDNQKKLFQYSLFFQGIFEPLKGLINFSKNSGYFMLNNIYQCLCLFSFYQTEMRKLKMICVIIDLARHNEPSTIFIDKMDLIMGQRGSASKQTEGRRMNTQLLLCQGIRKEYNLLQLVRYIYHNLQNSEIEKIIELDII